jgi:anthranilate phosphoribosyltransferase
MFNILGPLASPARPDAMVVGVAEREIGDSVAYALREGGAKRALVVCGAEGLDEISCAGDTFVWELINGTITTTTIHPRMFGLPVHPLSSVVGGGPAENAETFQKLLRSGEAIPESLTGVLHFVLMNTAALLVVAGLAADYRKGVEMAMTSIVSGKAWEAFETFRESGRDRVE